MAKAQSSIISFRRKLAKSDYIKNLFKTEIIPLIKGIQSDDARITAYLQELKDLYCLKASDAAKLDESLQKDYPCNILYRFIDESRLASSTMTTIGLSMLTERAAKLTDIDSKLTPIEDILGVRYSRVELTFKPNTKKLPAIRIKEPIEFLRPKQLPAKFESPETVPLQQIKTNRDQKDEWIIAKSLTACDLGKAALKKMIANDEVITGGRYITLQVDITTDKTELVDAFKEVIQDSQGAIGKTAGTEVKGDDPMRQIQQNLFNYLYEKNKTAFADKKGSLTKALDRTKSDLTEFGFDKSIETLKRDYLPVYKGHPKRTHKRGGP